MTLLLQTLLGAVTLGMGLGQYENGNYFGSFISIAVSEVVLIS